MVRTGGRAARLASLLAALGKRVADHKPPAPRTDGLPSEAREQIAGLYKSFGGSVGRQLRPGPWDLALTDGVLIELDEEFHFTRYRMQTLQLPFASELPWTPKYRDHCEAQERSSIAGGGRWASVSTIAMFGDADAVGEFASHGSPRGKQRAIYDAMKDAAASGGQIALARISVHDRVGDASLDDVLRDRAACDGEALLGLVEARTLRSQGE